MTTKLEVNTFLTVGSISCNTMHMEVQIVRNSAAEIEFFWKENWLTHCLPRQNTSSKQKLEDAWADSLQTKQINVRDDSLCTNLST
jgi:hypothetical protein